MLLPFLIRERIGDDPRLFGFLLAVYGLGGVLGSIFVSSRKLPRRYLTTMNLVWGISTLPFIIVGFTDQYWLLLASMFLIGFGFSYGNVIWGTLLQRRVPRHMLGRISSLDFFVSLALMPLSMALAGPLSEVLSLQVIFTAAGVLTLVVRHHRDLRRAHAAGRDRASAERLNRCPPIPPSSSASVRRSRSG